MALLLLESFDHTTFAQLLTKWTQNIAVAGGVAPVLSSSAGRRSTSGLRCGPSGNGGYPIAVTLPQASGARCIVGFAFNQSTSGFANLDTAGTLDPETSAPGSGSNVLFSLRQGGTNQVAFRINADGTIGAYRGTAEANLLGTTAIALTAATWQYLEFEVLINGATGTVNIYIDGVSALALTGKNTLNTASATWNEIVLGHVMGTLPVWDFDDIYIADGNTVNSDGTTSTWTTAKQVDIRVDAVFPTADGTTSGFTCSTGSSHFALVDETPANGDTDYNSAAAAATKDTLNFPNAPVTGADIFGLQVVAEARKTDSGSAGHKAVTRIGAADYDGSELGVPSSYAFLRQCWDAKPSNNAAWTDTDFNAAEFGYKKST